MSYMIRYHHHLKQNEFFARKQKEVMGKRFIPTWDLGSVFAIILIFRFFFSNPILRNSYAAFVIYAFFVVVFLTLYSILFISFSVSSESVLQLQLQASKEALPPMYS